MTRYSKAYIGLFLAFLLSGAFSCGSSGSDGRVIDLLPPAGLVATAVSSQQINLSWLDQSSDEEGFILERKISGGEFQPLFTMSANSQAFSDVGLSASTAYFYRLRAFKGATFSNYSNEATATTFTAATSAPLAPTLNSATAINSTSIKIEWTDNSNNELGFRIERSLQSGSGFAQIAEVGANAVEFTDTGLASSTEYFYRVRAYNGIGNSLYSLIKSAKTFASSTQGLMLVKISISSDSRYGIDYTQMIVDNGKLQLKLLNDGECPQDPTVTISKLKFDAQTNAWEQVYSNQTWDLFPTGAICNTNVLSNQFDLRLNDIVSEAFDGIVLYSRIATSAKLIKPTDMHSFDLPYDDVHIYYAYVADVSQITGYENISIGTVDMDIDVPYNPLAGIVTHARYILHLENGELMLELLGGERPKSNPIVTTSHFTQLGWETLLSKQTWALAWTSDPNYFGLVTNKFDCGFSDLIDDGVNKIFNGILELGRYRSNVNIGLRSPIMVELYADEAHTDLLGMQMFYVYRGN